MSFDFMACAHAKYTGDAVVPHRYLDVQLTAEHRGMNLDIPVMSRTRQCQGARSAQRLVLIAGVRLTSRRSSSSFLIGGFVVRD
jgi:hypothetical protein